MPTLGATLALPCVVAARSSSTAHAPRTTAQIVAENRVCVASHPRVDARASLQVNRDAMVGPQYHRLGSGAGRGCARRVVTECISNGSSDLINGIAIKADDFQTVDEKMLVRTIELAVRDLGKTQPHPNAGCVLTDSSEAIVGEGALYANGAPSCEVTAVEAAAGKKLCEVLSLFWCDPILLFLTRFAG